MTAPDSPKIAGLGPTIRHLDDPDVPWQKVRAQRNADGSESFVHEKWLAFLLIRNISRCTPSTTRA